MARRPAIRRGIRWVFIAWAVFSTAWLFNAYRTQGVPGELLASSATVSVDSARDSLVFTPTGAASPSGLLFIVGAGVAAEAYAPLLRPIAEKGHAVFVVKLPYSIAPLERHKETAIDRAQTIMRANANVKRWVVAGHSLGGALTSRLVAQSPGTIAAAVLIGTSHPKTFDLRSSEVPITKVFATNDGIATVEMIDATRALLPRRTRWIAIEGGNHSQFGHYGHQPFDGSATVSREQQQDVTRRALLESLEEARDRSSEPR